MVDDYQKKTSIFKRMWNKIFHKRLMLPAPIQYTSKEVKLKMQEIANFLRYGVEMKNKDIQKIENRIATTNVYFYEKGQKEINNEFNTYLHTVKRERIVLEKDQKLILSDPVTKSNMLLEVFPILNLEKVNRKKYIMNIYLNSVKLFASSISKTGKISKNTSVTTFYSGINSKRVFVYNGKISAIKNSTYNMIDMAFVYLISQMLYEAIENEPFLFELSRKEEKIIKQVKYYISKSYIDNRSFIIDYMLCKKEKIERKFAKNTNIQSFRELEKNIRKSIE